MDLVSVDDIADKLVADNIGFVKIDKADSLNILQYLRRMSKSGIKFLCKINLGDIAGNDGLRIYPQSCQAHFHQFR